MHISRCRMAQSILNLTFEIIYLLTGEDYVIVKKSSESVIHSAPTCVANKLHRIPSHSKSSFANERSIDKKILGLISKILHLLTGEELKNFERYTDVYQEVTLEEYGPSSSLVEPVLSSGPEESHPTLHELPGNKCEGVRIKDHCQGGETLKAKENRPGNEFSNRKENMTVNDSAQANMCKEYTAFACVKNGPVLRNEDAHSGNGASAPSEGTLTEYTPIKEESTSTRKRDHPDLDIRMPAEHVPKEWTSGSLTGESFSWKRHVSDTDIHKSTEHTHTRCEPKLEADKCDDEAFSTFIEHDPQEHLSQFKKELPSCYGQILTDMDSCKLTESTRTECNSAADRVELHALKEENDIPGPTRDKQTECNSNGDKESNDHNSNAHRSHTVSIGKCSECGKNMISSDCTSHGQTLSSEKMCQRCIDGQLRQADHRGNKLACAVCGKEFSYRSRLVTHQRNHTGEKPFPCSECGKAFTWLSHLAAHLRIHTGEKPFSCSLCEKCFTNSASLIAHQRSHTGEKPFSCSVCGKCFTNSTYLVTHQRIHTGEKPFSCSECGKCFTDKSSFLRHLRIHTGEKPFSCSVCGKCFIEKSSLIRHQVIHTKKKPFTTQ